MAVSSRMCSIWTLLLVVAHAVAVFHKGPPDAKLAVSDSPVPHLGALQPATLVGKAMVVSPKIDPEKPAAGRKPGSFQRRDKPEHGAANEEASPKTVVSPHAKDTQAGPSAAAKAKARKVVDSYFQRLIRLLPHTRGKLLAHVIPGCRNRTYMLPVLRSTLLRKKLMHEVATVDVASPGVLNSIFDEMTAALPTKNLYVKLNVEHPVEKEAEGFSLQDIADFSSLDMTTYTCNFMNLFACASSNAAFREAAVSSGLLMGAKMWSVMHRLIYGPKPKLPEWQTIPQMCRLLLLNGQQADPAVDVEERYVNVLGLLYRDLLKLHFALGLPWDQQCIASVPAWHSQCNQGSFPQRLKHVAGQAEEMLLRGPSWHMGHANRLYRQIRDRQSDTDRKLQKKYHLQVAHPRRGVSAEQRRLTKHAQSALKAQCNELGQALVAPTDGIVVSGFGYRRTPNGGQNRHTGIDIVGRRHAPVYAAADGVVEAVIIGCSTKGSRARFCGSGKGNHIRIRHNQTRVGIATSLYAHLQESTSVNGKSVHHVHVVVGQRVKQGQFIATTGSTGDVLGSGSPHLHFATRKLLAGQLHVVNPCHRGLLRCGGRYLHSFISEESVSMLSGSCLLLSSRHSAQRRSRIAWRMCRGPLQTPREKGKREFFRTWVKLVDALCAKELQLTGRRCKLRRCHVYSHHMAKPGVPNPPDEDPCLNATMVSETMKSGHGFRIMRRIIGPYSDSLWSAWHIHYCKSQFRLMDPGGGKMMMFAESLSRTHAPAHERAALPVHAACALQETTGERQSACAVSEDDVSPPSPPPWAPEHVQVVLAATAAHVLKSSKHLAPQSVHHKHSNRKHRDVKHSGHQQSKQGGQLPSIAAAVQQAKSHARQVVDDHVQWFIPLKTTRNKDQQPLSAPAKAQLCKACVHLAKMSSELLNQYNLGYKAVGRSMEYLCKSMIEQLQRVDSNRIDCSHFKEHARRLSKASNARMLCKGAGLHGC